MGGDPACRVSHNPLQVSRQHEQIGLTIAPSRQLDSRHLLQLVRLAESAGFDSAWVPETWGSDAVSLLAVLSRETESIRLAAGVFNVYSRSAMVLAQTAATLQGLSNGRFLLGLGASGPAVVERWHGMSYRRPVARTREYIGAIRLALDGSKVDYDGEDVRLGGFKLQNPPEVRVPIYVAALGPKNMRLTGEVADGWLGIFAALGHMQPLFSDLKGGAVDAGRDMRSIDVAAYIPAACGPRAELLLRQQIAYYVGGMGTFYAEMLSRLGFESDVRQIRDAWEIGDRSRSIRSVSEAVLDACTIAGAGPGTIRRLDEFRRDGISLPILALPHGTRFEEAADLIQGLSPAVRSESGTG